MGRENIEKKDNLYKIFVHVFIDKKNPDEKVIDFIKRQILHRE